MRASWPSASFVSWYGDPQSTGKNDTVDVPVLSSIDSVLFVVDTANTELGTGGQVWIDDVRYAK